MNIGLSVKIVEVVKFQDQIPTPSLPPELPLPGLFLSILSGYIVCSQD